MSYQEDAQKTELKDYEPSYDRLDPSRMRLLHGAMGLVTESGELLDSLKKTIYYGKPLDKANIIEEIGDALWYVAILCSWANISIERVQEINISKLRARYPNQFTEGSAVNRDLDAERRILEDGSKS